VTCLLAVSLVLVAACGGGSGAGTDTSATVPSESVAIGAATEDAAELGSIEEQIQALMSSGDLPSLAAATVVDDDIAWAEAFGEQQDVRTAYMIGSIEKVFVAMAVLQLVEEGLVDLNIDVGE